VAPRPLPLVRIPVALLLLGVSLAADPATSGAAPAPPPRYKEKILGTWEVTKSEDSPAGTLVEFAKGGKLKVTVKVPGGGTETAEAAYAIDGDKITVTLKGPDGKEMKETAVITKLTDTEMATKDDKGKIDEFKRKK
jgi:uncharacterized protein (TIGR03066 family)